MPKVSQHPADEICAVMTRIYDANMTTVSGGNLSIRDEAGNIWVSPSGGDKAALAHDDVLKVEPGGRVVGTKKSSLETPIHLGIMAARPDLRAILHAHPPALVALSLVHETPKTRLIGSLHALAGESRIARYATPGSAELVENVTAVFKTGCNIAVLENHGVFIGSAESLSHAYGVFEALDFGARTQINARTLTGAPARELTDEQLAAGMLRAPALPAFVPEFRSGAEYTARADAAKFTRRACLKQLFTRAQGSFSVRVDADSFVIGPEGADNALIEPEDFVLISGGHAECGKTPHPDAALHTAVYAAKRDVGALAVGCPPWAMTFAVTDAEYDVRLIPECYNRLRETRKFPYGARQAQTEALAAYLQNNRPVAIIENDCVAIAADTALNAYDRLEIAEYCAKSVHYTKRLGEEIRNITQEQIDALTARFNLK